MKYFLTADTAILQGANQDGKPHTIRYASWDGLECWGQTHSLVFLQGEVGAVLCDCLHSEEAKVTHILFYGGKEASERGIVLKDHVDETKQKDAETVFKAFVNSFEKSSSHWHARDEYLSDIKQAKH